MFNLKKFEIKITMFLTLFVSTVAAATPSFVQSSINEKPKYPYFVKVVLSDGYVCGGSIVSESVSTHEIENFIRHEKHDLMLVRVKPHFQFDEDVQPIQLQDAELPKDSVGWIVGSDGDLQKSIVPIMDKNMCGSLLEWPRKLEPGVVCGPYHRVKPGLCTGDLGGPLVVNGRLAGVVSRAHSCDDPYALTFYTEVAYFRDWIRKYAGV